MTKFNPHSYTVVFDSSSLYGEPIARQIRELIETFSTTDKVDLHVYIPEVVEKELERRVIDDITTKHKQTLKGVRSLQTYFPDISAAIPAEIGEPEILKAKGRILEELGIEIIPTPTDKLDWNDAIYRATRYKLPFEVAHEKGFKDYVIAETAVQHFIASKNGRFCMFVCNDDKLTAYLRERTADMPRFFVFDSVPALTTDIQLRLDESTRKIADVLLQEAAQGFYSQTDDSALFNARTFQAQADAKVKELLDSEPFKKRYPAYRIANQGRIKNIQIAKPTFMRRPNRKTFCWQSVIVAEVGLELAESIDAYFTKNLLLKVEFLVEWSASFTKKGEINSETMKVEKFILSSYDMRLLVTRSVEEYESAPPDKKLTTSGQPTFPVGQDAADK